jgi:hypothetical protein
VRPTSTSFRPWARDCPAKIDYFVREHRQVDTEVLIFLDRFLQSKAGPELRALAPRCLDPIRDYDAVGPLVSLLADEEIRREIVLILGMLGDKAAIPKLIASIDLQRDDDLNSYILEALDKLGAEETVLGNRPRVFNFHQTPDIQKRNATNASASATAIRPRRRINPGEFDKRQAFTNLQHAFKRSFGDVDDDKLLKLRVPSLIYAQCQSCCAATSAGEPRLFLG